MSNTNIQAATKLLKDIDAKIQRALVENEVLEQSLARLRPKRDALVEKCREQFGCNIADLPAVLAAEEADFAAEVDRLAAAIEKATT